MTVSYQGGGDYNLYFTNKMIVLTESEIDAIQEHAFSDVQTLPQLRDENITLEIDNQQLQEEISSLDEENGTLYKQLADFKQLVESMGTELKILVEKFENITDNH